MQKPFLNTILLILFLLIPGYSSAGDHPRCQLCGMDLNKYTHVRYTMNTVDKQQISTCGVQCGLLLQLNLGNKFDSATATTLLNHRVIPVSEAWYVYKSSIITDMSPGFIAFSSKKRATNFVKGFGGKVLTFEQSLQVVKAGFQ
jgi:DeoR family transcriptional regulator, copper-sensing transcriptional repressor